MQKIMKALRLLSFYWKPFKWRIALLGFLNIFNSFFKGVGVLMLIPLLSFIVKNPSTENNEVIRIFNFISDYINVGSSLELILFLYMLLFVVTSLINYFSSMQQAKFQNKFVMGLRNSMFKAFVNSPWKVIKDESHSKFSQFITVEIGQISGFNKSVLSILSSFIVLSVHLVIAFYLSAMFTIFLILAVVVILFVTRKAFSSSYDTGKRNFEKNNVLIKGVENIKSVFKYCKLHNNEDWVADRFEDANAEYAHGVIKVRRITLLSQTVMSIIGMFVLMGVIYFSLKMKNISQESIFLFIVVFSRIYPKVNAIYKQLVSSGALLTSVSKFHDKIRELDNFKDGMNMKSAGKMEFCSEIRLENIGLAFGDKMLYENLDICIEKNTLFGIYGASGSGKTSLLDIIAGLHMEYSGSVAVDGIKLDDSNVAMWKNNIAVVSQDTYFIEGSIRENLLFGEVADYDEYIYELLKRCRIYDAVAALPGGLDSDVQNIEYILSGGEKKRFGLARALLRNADLLLMDEPTSGLDPATETEIMDMIKSLTNDYTVVIVSHNQSLKQYADRLVEIGGEVCCQEN